MNKFTYKEQHVSSEIPNQLTAHKAKAFVITCMD